MCIVTPAPRRQAQLRRSDMSIVNALGKGRAPSGAACRNPKAKPNHVPLLTELEQRFRMRGSYRHAAPTGALTRVLRYEGLSRQHAGAPGSRVKHAA